MQNNTVKAICELQDGDLIREINKHPKYNAVGSVNTYWLAVYESYHDRVYPRPNRKQAPYSVEGMVSDGYIDCNFYTGTEREAYRLFLTLVNDYSSTSEKLGKYYRIRHMEGNKVEYVRRTSLDQFKGKNLREITRLKLLEFLDLVKEGEIVL